MSLLSYIRQTVQDLVEKSGTRNPLELAEAENIFVSFKDLGSLKGFFVNLDGEPNIVINIGLDEHWHKTVLAHELGHAVLHCKQAINLPYLDYKLSGRSTKIEYEANLFAADLLIDDKSILSELVFTTDITSLAVILHCPAEYVMLKLKLLRTAGYTFNLPLDIDNNFLGK